MLPVDDPDDHAAFFGRAVADAGALDATAHAGVLRVAVDVLHRVERLAEAAHAFAHHLAGGKAIARVEDVARADLPPVHADALGQHPHDAFDGEVPLVGAEATHRAARRVVRVDGAGLHRHARH